MKFRSTFPLALSIATATGLFAGTLTTVVSATTTNSALCDQLLEQMNRSMQGTATAIRSQEEYRKQCAEIKDGCPSKLVLATAVKRCADADQFASTYIDASQCQQVRCSVEPPKTAVTPYKEAPSISPQTGLCPTGDVLARDAKVCYDAHKDYEFQTVNGCRAVRCYDTDTSIKTCPSPEENKKTALRCKSIGQDLEYSSVRVQEGVCRIARCKNDALPNSVSTQQIVNGVKCPSDSDLDKAVAVCAKAGLKSTVRVADDSNCRQVYCDATLSSGRDTGGTSIRDTRSRCYRNPNALVCRIQNKRR